MLLSIFRNRRFKGHATWQQFKTEAATFDKLNPQITDRLVPLRKPRSSPQASPREPALSAPHSQTVVPLPNTNPARSHAVSGAQQSRDSGTNANLWLAADPNKPGSGQN